MARDEHAQLVCSQLNRAGCWPVTIPQSPTRIQPGQVYLLPAEKDGVITEKHQLTLQTPAQDSYSSPSVNRLLNSLADHYSSRVLALILSGAGSDGAQGCRRVKHKQGAIWVQSPVEAQYDSMPLAACAAVTPDLVATLSELADKLLRKLNVNSGTQRQTQTLSDDKQQRTPAIQITDSDDTELEHIIDLIADQTGISFFGYKRETLLRRLEKRKAGFSYPKEALTNKRYIDYLQQHPDELESLAQFFLVSISSFYRDADVFRALTLALRASAEEKINRYQNSVGQVFRILVAGCATGEEAYTLRILYQQLALPMPLEIVAVDLNKEAIRNAKKGKYSSSRLTEMPAELIPHYFQQSAGAYTINPEVKETVHFIQGDIFKQSFDDPFDFISCRNLMIYLKRELQDQLINQFYQQMSPGAALVIGLTESLSPLGLRLFSTEDYYHRIFRRR